MKRKPMPGIVLTAPDGTDLRDSLTRKQKLELRGQRVPRCMVAVAQSGSVRGGRYHPGMAQNFLACDRDQELLLPPSLREWLPEGHLVWFVIDAVAALDLSAFYAAYRDSGQGRAAHDPAMMVALLLYSYAVGERSSRRIERRCVEDVATRVICANQRPDPTTVARFRQRHERALAGLFGEVLALCAEAGLVCVGVIAVDGTKVHANASERATRGYEEIAREILDDAAAVDAEEEERFGDARGDELPSELATGQGRQRWLRDAKRRLDERRAAEAKSIRRSRPDRSKRPGAAWKKSTGSSAEPTRPMRITVATGG
jgi:transposase